MEAHAVVHEVREAASRVVRHLPEAHSAWEFWRKAWFRRAAERFTDLAYGLDVSRFQDEDFQLVENLVETGAKIIEIHMVGLRSDLRDVVDKEFFAALLRNLHTAIEGLQQGLPPDPDRRPSDDQLMSRLDSSLRHARAVATVSIR